MAIYKKRHQNNLKIVQMLIDTKAAVKSIKFISKDNNIR